MTNTAGGTGVGLDACDLAVRPGVLRTPAFYPRPARGARRRA